MCNFCSLVPVDILDFCGGNEDAKLRFLQSVGAQHTCWDAAFYHLADLLVITRTWALCASVNSHLASLFCLRIGTSAATARFVRLVRRFRHIRIARHVLPKARYYAAG